MVKSSVLRVQGHPNPSPQLEAGPCCAALAVLPRFQEGRAWLHQARGCTSPWLHQWHAARWLQMTNCRLTHGQLAPLGVLVLLYLGVLGTSPGHAALNAGHVLHAACSIKSGKVGGGGRACVRQRVESCARRAGHVLHAACRRKGKVLGGWEWD